MTAAAALLLHAPSFASAAPAGGRCCPGGIGGKGPKPEAALVVTTPLPPPLLPFIRPVYVCGGVLDWDRAKYRLVGWLQLQTARGEQSKNSLPPSKVQLLAEGRERGRIEPEFRQGRPHPARAYLWGLAHMCIKGWRVSGQTVLCACKRTLGPTERGASKSCGRDPSESELRSGIGSD